MEASRQKLPSRNLDKKLENWPGMIETSPGVAHQIWPFPARFHLIAAACFRPMGRVRLTPLIKKYKDAAKKTSIITKIHHCNRHACLKVSVAGTDQTIWKIQSTSTAAANGKAGAPTAIRAWQPASSKTFIIRSGSRSATRRQSKYLIVQP